LSAVFSELGVLPKARSESERLTET